MDNPKIDINSSPKLLTDADGVLQLIDDCLKLGGLQYLLNNYVFINKTLNDVYGSQKKEPETDQISKTLNEQEPE